jgi:hypothetical protein
MKIRADPVKHSVGSERALGALPAKVRYADKAAVQTSTQGGACGPKPPFDQSAAKVGSTPILSIIAKCQKGNRGSRAYLHNGLLGKVVLCVACRVRGRRWTPAAGLKDRLAAQCKISHSLSPT